MGKGDKRTRRGKIFKGSYGKTRPQRKKTKKRAPARQQP
jgi:30S ribosomal protein S31